MLRRRCSDSGVVDLGVDTACSLGSTILGHPDVAIVTPAGSPRVTDDEVRVGAGGVVTGGNDGMVSRGGATSCLEDSRFVGLEFVARGVDSNSDGLSINSRHHGGVVSRDVFVSRGVNLGLG